jgi:hypothetical protein
MAEDDGPCHDGRRRRRATGSLTKADLAYNVRFGDDAGQHFIATAHDHEIGLGDTREFRRGD